MLDCMHEDLNRADKDAIIKKRKEEENQVKMSGKREVESNEEESHQELTEEQQELMACEAWKDHLVNNRSIVVDLL